MKTPLAFSIALIWLALVPAPPGHASAMSSPVGLWKTIDDKTGAPRAMVRIYEKDGRYFGRIEKSFSPGAETRVCSKCSDERKDQPIIGLILIRNMTAHGDEFSGGDILDPDNGSVYRCKFHLEGGGNQLSVRGFIGMALLGRSQTWIRQL